MISKITKIQELFALLLSRRNIRYQQGSSYSKLIIRKRIQDIKIQGAKLRQATLHDCLVICVYSCVCERARTLYEWQQLRVHSSLNRPLKMITDSRICFSRFGQMTAKKREMKVTERTLMSYGRLLKALLVVKFNLGITLARNVNFNYI